MLISYLVMCLILLLVSTSNEIYDEEKNNIPDLFYFFLVLKVRVMNVLVAVPTTKKMTWRTLCTALDLDQGQLS